MDELNSDGFKEYRLLIMDRFDNQAKRLDQLSASLTDVHKDLIQIRSDIVELKTKSMMWGGLAGAAATTVIGLVLKMFFSFKIFLP